MTKRRAGIVLIAAALLPMTQAFTRGGWWVYTVENLPEYLVAGEEFELSISVRQHGMGLGGLPTPPQVLLARPGASAQGWEIPGAIPMSVSPSAKPGYYTANIVAPAPVDWNIIIQAAGGPIRLQLLPLGTIAAGAAAPAAIAIVERGRQLYVAKGCVTCHGSSATQNGAPGSGSTRVNVAPELIGREYPSREYVARVLADPGARAMPKLNLSVDEIRAISTFLHPGS